MLFKTIFQPTNPSALTYYYMCLDGLRAIDAYSSVEKFLP